jgi:spore germination cell wall hydrolase CwlJ-like protein
MNRRTLIPVAVPVPPAPAAAALTDTNAAWEETVDILARTLWGEARGEPLRGIEAVAAVVLNRVALATGRRGWWWGNTIIQVCRKPFQFSCWNEGDPNRARLMDVDAGDLVFATCRRIARRAAAGLLDDPTRGATHYHNRTVDPGWAQGRTPCAEIGNHLFYKDLE